MKNRAPRRWVQMLNVSVWSRKILLTHPRNEYIGGRWLCRRNSLSFSQSGREWNGIECHAQLDIFGIFEQIFFSSSGIDEVVGKKDGEGERLHWSACTSVGSDCLDIDNCSSDGVFCCIRLRLPMELEADIVKSLSAEMSDRSYSSTIHLIKSNQLYLIVIMIYR